MKSFFKPVLLAAALATAGFAAFSQVPAMGQDCMMGQGGMHRGMQGAPMGKMDPARMQARMDQHSAALKAQLKVTPAQEAAWSTFAAAMKPTGAMLANRPDREQLAKLTTPERIDTLQALHTKRMADMSAAMTQRGDATKAFYAVLTPEQQKVFDASTARHFGQNGRMGGHRGHKGPMGPMGPMGAVAPKL
ncbi:MAG: Spy/CpxP family protein refolding chaperone [Rhodoferax sp.]|uniref:Spy/CpxP family protein refolding chaperone n=1 Tax=Rhodoferax sp. TaxID=50421 RepID=UPI0013FF2F0F|nr:Spy/CpxP family protein refolding chaperone [Rhodoferax sp.]NDP40168.1 Spy/CpxP family protein refolding chaperone [Rhodoferax sp.]